MPAAATASATSRWRSSGCSPRLTQWLAVTGCGNSSLTTSSARSASPSTDGSSTSSVCRSTPTPRSAAIVEQHLGGAPRAVALEVGAAADEIGPDVEGGAEQGPLVGAVRTGHRPPAQRDDLDVDDVGDAVAQRHQRLDAGQAVVQRRVGVRAHGAHAVGGEQAGRPLGPLEGLGHVQPVAGGPHRVDGAEQVAGLVRHHVGQERLVEVGVRFDGGREQEVAAQLDDVVAVGRGRDRAGRADGGDGGAVEAHVGRRSVDQRHVPQERRAHGGQR